MRYSETDVEHMLSCSLARLKFTVFSPACKIKSPKHTGVNLIMRASVCICERNPLFFLFVLFYPANNVISRALAVCVLAWFHLHMIA